MCEGMFEWLHHTFSPVLVLQVRPSLLASTAAVTVVPLLPPQPTSITPSRGTCLSVRKVISVVRGVTCVPVGKWVDRTRLDACVHTKTIRKSTYRDAVPFCVDWCSLVGVLGGDVLLCVPHIGAVDVDVHRHGCWSLQRHGEVTPAGISSVVCRNSTVENRLPLITSQPPLSGRMACRKTEEIHLHLKSIKT